MTKFTLEIHDDIVSTLNKIQNLNDTGIEIEIPEGSVLFENVLNLKLIRKHADKFGATVHFVTTDPAGINLIEMVEEGTTKYSLEARQEVVENFMPDGSASGFALSELASRAFSKFKLPDLTQLKTRLSKTKLAPIIIAGVLILLFHLNQTQREATAKIIINSQPLTRSMTVKVKAGSPTNPQDKVLAGTNVKNTLEVTKEEATTGEKVIGEKAEGKAILYNKTSDEQEFDKGTVLVYDRDEGDLNFLTQDGVTVPAATPDPGDPAKNIPGEVEVDIQAENVGEEYNIDKDKTLEVKDEKKADFTAKTVGDLSGGKSEKIRVVSEADITKVKAALDQEITNQATQSLNQKIESAQSLVTGSLKSTLIKETPSHKVDDEAEKLSMNRIVEVEGLAYLKSELDRLLDTLVKEFVPDGFVLSSKDREVGVEVLGNSSNSVLSSVEADLQVTLKTFVVPDISEESIKKDLAGKSSSDAQKFLGSIQNIKTFEFKLSRGFLPFFNSVPRNQGKIKVEIVRE